VSTTATSEISASYFFMADLNSMDEIVDLADVLSFAVAIRPSGASARGSVQTPRQTRPFDIDESSSTRTTSHLVASRWIVDIDIPADLGLLVRLSGRLERR